MAKASAERPHFAERERALERLIPERWARAPSNSTFLKNIRNTVKMFFHYKKLIFIKYNFLYSYLKNLDTKLSHTVWPGYSQVVGASKISCL
jgi:hypothetical protein